MKQSPLAKELSKLHIVLKQLSAYIQMELIKKTYKRNRK